MVDIIQWREVEPLSPINGDVAAMLATIDELKRIWVETVSSTSPEEFAETRQRTLRRHAIETGIIERLYAFDQGVTEALVAHGLTLEVAARQGGVSEDTLTVIRDQYEALEYLSEAASGDHPLTLQFIRELHQLITRHQPTYAGHDPLGRLVEASLPHGTWKTAASHVRRADGSLLEYVPPEHVQAEMERLLTEYEKTYDAHPVVRAAWLHHRFIRIHPFADGNGRVARVLTLLVLLRERYAPIVVESRQRDDYIDSLELANAGDLRGLVRFFARIEGIALRSELTQPIEQMAPTAGAVAVARAYVDRIRARSEQADLARAQRAEQVAGNLYGRLEQFLRRQADELAETFRAVDAKSRTSVRSAAPPSPEATHWRHQLIAAARAVGFFSNLRNGSWWARLQVVVFGQRLRYIVAVQKLGLGETGVLVVTCWAELVEQDGVATADGPDEARALPKPVLDLTPDDGVTVLYTDDPQQRWPQVADLVERTLAAAVDQFGQQLA